MREHCMLHALWLGLQKVLCCPTADRDGDYGYLGHSPFGQHMHDRGAHIVQVEHSLQRIGVGCQPQAAGNSPVWTGESA